MLADLFFLDLQYSGKLCGTVFGAGQQRHDLLTNRFHHSFRTGTLTMKQIALMALLILVLPAALTAASGRGIRCGSDLVSPGYLKFEVLQTCGEPVSREIVGEVEIFDGDRFYDRSSRSRQSRGSKLILYIEEWIYQRETLFLLRFEGNRLVNVESVRSK